MKHKFITGLLLMAAMSLLITSIALAAQKGNNVNADMAAVCNLLKRGYTGSGSSPTLSPANSVGCKTGRYKVNEIITVTAHPANGWLVGSWSGTTNNASTNLTNTVKMPAGTSKVTVNYVAACYLLTLTHTGNGLNPVANPTASTGCASGKFHFGANITLTASPSTNWIVGNWSGTNNNASKSTTNTLTMPKSDHVAGVNYVEKCHTLTLTHSGNGANPGANPLSSSGCGAGQYITGEIIALTAVPDSNWSVGNWNGTDDDLNKTTSNQVTMPAKDHSVGVYYVENMASCYFLALIHAGNGSDPVPAPIKSTTCSANYYYTAGEAINFTANPTVGWSVKSWNGTSNDSSTSKTNSATMPASNHIVRVNYVSGIVTKNFRSQGLNDGFVRESSETSNKGGSYNSNGTVFNIGDNAMNRQFRVVLSFNTYRLPDNAVITSVTVKIMKQKQVGTDPFTTHKNLRIVIRKPYFGKAVTLAAHDFQALANKGAGPFINKNVAGWYSANLSKYAYPFINTTGITQLRLQFGLDDDNDHAADYLRFYSGNYSYVTYRPLLIVKYYLP
jgi:hypothetical protein